MNLVIGIEQDDNDYNKWIGIVKEALSCLNKKNYTWIHLPGAGGFYDQDSFLMDIWNVIANEFFITIHDPEVKKFLESQSAQLAT